MAVGPRRHSQPLPRDALSRAREGHLIEDFLLSEPPDRHSGSRNGLLRAINSLPRARKGHLLKIFSLPGPREGYPGRRNGLPCAMNGSPGPVSRRRRLMRAGRAVGPGIGQDEADPLAQPQLLRPPPPVHPRPPEQILRLLPPPARRERVPQGLPALVEG